jgi:ABC-type sugar transport system permease subunit
MRRNVFSRYFSALAEGDPVALGATAFFLLFLAVVGLVAWYFKRAERREEEAKRKRWGLKDPKAEK